MPSIRGDCSSERAMCPCGVKRRVALQVLVRFEIAASRLRSSADLLKCRPIFPMRLLKEGETIRDTYEVERFLGEGAFAEVYRVKHKFFGRQALKIFKRSGMEESEICDALSEAVMLSRIGHPNIIRVFEANVLAIEKRMFGYFTMENIAGGSLDKFWRSYRGRLVPVETTVDLIRQVCRGLTVAHQASPPVIHRDIKPQNILVGYEADGLRARVSDFGLAKSVNPLTLLATAAGTLQFKPPEAFSKQKGDSCAADVWGVGTTMYLLLTDRLPFNFPQEVSWNSQRLFEEELVPPSEFNADVNRGLDNIVCKCLSKEPEHRYVTAKELLVALESWSPKEERRLRNLSSSQPDFSKAALGSPAPSPHRRSERDILKRAFSLRDEGRLADAADALEEALNKAPELRERYANQVKLWRCGISM
jgi:eukaryotic-like serine/threonine-protein kinase